MQDVDIIVIGAGPAGLFCAIHAAAPGIRVAVFEKNRNPGAKLLLSGSGQCNITHAGDIRKFLAHYGNHGRFLKPALHALSNRDLIAFFQERGLAMEEEDTGKIFPATRKASDVLSALVSACGEKGIILCCGEPVEKISRAGDRFSVQAAGGFYRASAVVITTGGASYPRCGTTGDGYRIASGLGQPVTETAPALTPLMIRRYPFADLAGMSFEQMRFSVWRRERKVADYAGDVLFTHSGLSGPGILDASRGILPGDIIRLSFTGPNGREEFAAGIARQAAGHPGRLVRSILSGYPVPDRLCRVLLKVSGIPDDMKCAHFPAGLRSALIANCTAFPLTVAALGDFGTAMVTRGGIALDGVDAKTMESKIVPGLFFAGEVLDIDGDTGGYNLQAAFSTGYLAAQGIRKKLGLRL